MRIFDFEDYRDFVVARLSAMPKRGRGQWQKLAEALRVHASLVSQIFQGNREITPEQALQTSEFLALTDTETDYFLALVNRNRAGTEKLRARYTKQIQALREQAIEIKARLQTVRNLDEESKGVFYSNWYYSAIRNLSGIPKYQNFDALAEYLDLPKGTLRNVVDFLIQHGLCVEVEGKILPGPSRTHLGADSPFALAHHRNWRLKAMERYHHRNKDDLSYSSPMTLAVKEITVVKELLVDTVGKIAKVVDASPSEQLQCLTIDWFHVPPK